MQQKTVSNKTRGGHALGIAFGITMVVLLLAGGAVAQPYAYITNWGSNSVSIIDTATDNVIHTVPVGFNPEGIAVNPDGTKVYVANYYSYNIAVIDTAKNTVDHTVKLKNYPMGIAVNPAGTKVYVAWNFGGGILSVIDTASNKIIDNVSMGKNTFASGVAVDPKGKWVYVVTDGYVGRFYNRTVRKIDTTTDNIIDTIDTKTKAGYSGYVSIVPAGGIAVNSDGTEVYVANPGSNTVAVIDTTIDTLKATGPGCLCNPLPVGIQPEGVAVNPKSGGGIVPWGTIIYVTNTGSDNVSVINTLIPWVIGTVNVGYHPTGIAVNPAGTKIYVANAGDDTVSVIDAKSLSVTATVPVGIAPMAFGQFIGPGPATRSYTFQTTYKAIKIYVDGTLQDSPYTVTWVDGTTHTVGISDSETIIAGQSRYVFTSWSGPNPSGSRFISVTAGASTAGTYSANYKTQYSLFVFTDPNGLPSISGDGWYDSGTTVTTGTAPSPLGSYTFSTWKVDGNPVSGNPITILMNAGHTATAVYTWPQYRPYTFNTKIDAMLIPMQIDVDGIWYNSPYSVNWLDGTTHSVSVRPSQLFAGGRKVFTSWSGFTSYKSNPTHWITAGPSTFGIYSANYKVQYSLTVNTNPAGLTLISGSGYYDSYTTATTGTAPVRIGVSAYTFSTWNVDGSPVSGNPISKLMDGPHTATAVYQVSGPTGTITGYVTDSSHQPLSDATVTAGIGLTAPPLDSSGKYTISFVPPGIYQVTASDDGYKKVSASVTVTAGATATQSFTLPILPPKPTPKPTPCIPGKCS